MATRAKTTSSPWRPITSGCCSAENSVFLGIKCKASSKNLRPGDPPMPSFRRLAYSGHLSNLSISSTSQRITSEELAQSFGTELYDFQLGELRAVTQGFSNAYLLGAGGFGKVHKGYVDEGVRAGLKPQPVAVKHLNIEGPQGHREWLAEVIFLGQLRHPNLVRLIGYCCEEEERLLVYEFMPRGSLENHLFKRLSISLPWGTRLRVAIGAAKGLAFLHGAEKPVIYRDFKTSNILLDSDFTAKLSDFGLATMGPDGSNTHVTTRVMGTYGYAAPEYISTGHLTTKSDVYSFGVVLLELLTGRRCMDKLKPKSEQHLIDWARPYMSSSRRLHRIMDPRLGGQYSVKGSKDMARLALQCVSPNPKDRPSMWVVVQALESLRAYSKDIAVASGHWTAGINSVGGNVKGGKNAIAVRGGRRERVGGAAANYRKPALVAPLKR